MDLFGLTGNHSEKPASESSDSLILSTKYFVLDGDSFSSTFHQKHSKVKLIYN